MESFQTASNFAAQGQGHQNAAAVSQYASGPTLRNLSARFEELHKEADALLSLAGDLVGHQVEEKASSNIHPVPGALLEQLDMSVSGLFAKLRAAREKFQRGHG